jgi:hypothetical protein
MLTYQDLWEMLYAPHASENAKLEARRELKNLTEQEWFEWVEFKNEKRGVVY